MENSEIILPREFEERMKEKLGENFERYKQVLMEKPIKGIRVNTKKISIQDFEKVFDLGIEKIDFTDNGFIFQSDEKIGNLPEHLAGIIYSQEPSSMVPVCASGIEGNVKVLDLCASPGGKSGQIACKIGDDAILFSNEIVPSRAEILYSNIERQGFKNVVILNEKPENLLSFEHYFDYVFVDAPCSGEGMFRKTPETILEWSKDNVLMCELRQKEILSVAQKLVAPNGKLVYSTCTFSDEEDEKIVDWFLNNFNYEIQDVSNEIKNVTESSNCDFEWKENARKFYPFSGKGEGQFVAVFKNLGSEENSTLHSKKHYKSIFDMGRSSRQIVLKFIEENLNEKIEGYFVQVGENVFLVPKVFDSNIQTVLDDLRFLSIGVKMGSIKKDRFEPNHAMFMAFGEKFKNKIELNECERQKYLHGEELRTDLDFKGYGCVTAKGFVIGGVKIAGGRLKNLYPKGLRI